MSGYIALVHKDDGTSYGVSFPDVPGCISAGDTLEEALANASEALSGHLALMRADGDAIPRARTLDEIKADPECAEEMEVALVRTVSPRLHSVSSRQFKSRIERQGATGRYGTDTKRNYHVIPDPKGGWQVKREGAERTSGHFATKSEAVGKGRDLARNARTKLVEHGRDGRINSGDSYGNDPNYPRDKKH